MYYSTSHQNLSYQYIILSFRVSFSLSFWISFRVYIFSPLPPPSLPSLPKMHNLNMVLVVPSSLTYPDLPLLLNSQKFRNSIIQYALIMFSICYTQIPVIKTLNLLQSKSLPLSSPSLTHLVSCLHSMSS